MALTLLQTRLLVALFEMAQADRPANVKRLAEVLDLRLGAVASELGALADLGLVHAARLRLTMPGLVVAASARRRLQSRPGGLALAA